jgi:diguanylate cyclase (GGDEF)-like protein
MMRRRVSGTFHAPALSSLFQAPSATLLVAGSEGERAVAMARLVITGLLLITPISKYISEPDNIVYALGFYVTAAAFLFALTIYTIMRRGRYGPWVGLTSSSFDVSFVTVALILFYGVAGPMAALGSKVTFEVYFLALAATALRYDARIVGVAGGLAMAQYGAIWAFAANHTDLANLPPDPGSGTFVPADQVTRLILLGSATAIALLLVSRAQKLQHEASTDALTGIANRAHFDRRIHAEFERARRYKRSLSVALIDVDRFKLFNDVHGHPTGDTVLVTVAAILNRQVRLSDVLARYGGEEFAYLLVESGLEGAYNKIDLIRRTVAATALGLPDAREPSRLTISAGIATYPADGNSVDLLIAVADDRLLLAKRLGRDRVMMTSEGEGSPEIPGPN